MRVEFIHSLPAVRSFEDRAELSLLTDWWRDTTGGVCTLVGIGGSGKTTLIDHFLRLLPGVLASSPDIEEFNLASPDSLLVYSFDSDPSLESMLKGLADVFEIAEANQTRPSYGQVLAGLRRNIAAAPGSRHLLVFDALEILQEQSTDEGSFGLLRDDRVRDLLERCALGQFPGVYILVSTRIPVATLEETEPPQYLRLNVGDLTTAEAISLMRLRGVEGPQALLKSLIDQIGSHALTIDLIAGYLVNFGDSHVQHLLDSTSLEYLEGLIGAEVSGRKRGVLRQARQRSQIFERYRQALKDQNASALAVLERVAILNVAFSRSVLEAIFIRPPGQDDLASEADLELTSAQVSAALSVLSELGLLQQARDGVFSIHPVVREAVLKWLSPSLRESGHRLMRDYLGHRLEQVPQAEWGHTYASLQLMEAYLLHTIEAGYAEDAWRYYWVSMGGFVNFGLNRAEFSRGSRICSYFVGKSPPENVLSAASLGSYESDFWIEWARYLKELGQLDSAEHCMLRAEGLSAGPMYDADKYFLASEHAEILRLRGKLQGALTEIRQHVRKRATTDPGESADQESIDQLQLHLAHAYSLLGDVKKALQAFKKLRDGWNTPFDGLLNNGYLYQAQLLSRLQKQDLAEVMEVTSVVYDQTGTWNTTLVPQWDLFLASEFAEEGDFEAAAKLLNRSKQYARARDQKDLLCQAAIVQARYTLNTIRTEINDQGSYPVGPVEQVTDELTEALEIARSSGLGLHVIDILIARARFALYLGWSFDALRDAQVAVNEGFEEDKRLGLPGILPAAASECGYRWAEADGREIIAEALMLDVAQFLQSSTVSKKRPPEVVAQLSQARDELKKAQKLRKQMGDPALEETNHLLEGLKSGQLGYYPLTPFVFAPESTAPSKADHQHWDVFVSYNSKDRKAAKWITNELRNRNLAVWLDEREIRGGTSWQSALDQILRSIPTALVLVGSYPLGPWQKSEVEMLLIEQKRRSISVIPVRLPGAPNPEDLPLFLPTLNSVDFTSVDSTPRDLKVIERLLALLPIQK